MPSIVGAVTRLEEERQRLELDVMGKTAREALEREIAKRSELVEKKAEEDAIAAELQKVVDVRQASVERIKKMVSAAHASETELQEAVGRVAEARAKLLEAQA